MDRAEFLRRVDVAMTLMGVTDNYACDQATVGRDWISKLRRFPKRKIDAAKAEKLALWLGVSPAYFLDAAVLDPMDVNPEWRLWAARAAEQGFGSETIEDRDEKVRRLTEAIYREIVEIARSGAPITESTARRLVPPLVRQVRQLIAQDHRTLSPRRKRRSRKPRS